MSNIRLDVAALESAIANLLVQYPELAEDDQLRADMMEGEGLNDVIAKLLDRERDAKAMAAAIHARRTDLAARKTRYERQQDAMRDLIQHLMERANISTVTLPEGTLSLTHRAPEPVIADEAALPDDFWKIVRTPDKTGIKDWWKTTGELPAGTVLSNGSTGISIRSK